MRKFFRDFLPVLVSLAAAVLIVFVIRAVSRKLDEVGAAEAAATAAAEAKRPKVYPTGASAEAGPYVVKTVGWFADDSAYKGWRYVYEVTEKATGRTWVGISGVGVSEGGVHKQGKTHAEDDR